MRRAYPHFAAVRAAVLVSAAAALPSRAQAPDKAVVPALPAASSFRSPAEAAAILRKLYFLNDYNSAGLLGDTLYARFRDSHVLAWYAGSLMRSLRSLRADSLTRRIDTASRDPWALVARSLVVARPGAPHDADAARAAVRLAQRAFAIAPRDPDIAWRLADALGGITNNDTAVVAFVDSVAPRLGNPSELLARRARSLYVLSFTPKADTAKREAAWRAYAAIRAADTSNYTAIAEAASYFDGEKQHEADVSVLARRAVARSPRSTSARSEYWYLLGDRPGVSREQRRADVAADRNAWLRQMDSATWAMWSVASSVQRDTLLRDDFAALTDRIIAKAPASPQADAARLARIESIGDSLNRALDTTVKNAQLDSTALRQRYIAALEGYLARPVHPSPGAHGQAALRLFLLVRDDSTYPASRLAALVHTMVDNNSDMNFTITHTYAARSLADHKSDFAYAESLARDGEKLAAWYMSIMPASIYSSVGERADALDAMKASQRDALAWVYYNQGRYDDAQRELDIALDLTKKDPTIYYHLGKLRQAQGRAEDAELAFTQGMTLRYRGVNPNRKELETAYRQHHGSMDGWPEYVAQLEAKERATRKARILAAKPSDVSLGQGFKLVSLSGDSVSSASLKGHYTVVNFWGTWCGPCVAEMPELQQFYDKYRKDSSVVVLTISNDKDLQELKDWMAKRKYTIPTLYDDGYVSAAGIEAWPTTWFIDPDGKVRYTAVGNGGALVEEWSWRLEAMRPAPVTP